jgi:uncharacterized damage-inducible protein DinB
MPRDPIPELTMSPSQIQELFDYTHWAFDRVWSAIDQLTDTQFTADVGYSLGSIRNLVIHLISSHRRWMGRLKMAKVPPHLNFDDFPSRQSARTAWDQARAEWLRYIPSLSQADLDEVVPCVIASRGIEAANTRWEILIHLVNHSTDHRSQVLALLNRTFAVPTPEQDFIVYLWESKQHRSGGAGLAG